MDKANFADSGKLSFRLLCQYVKKWKVIKKNVKNVQPCGQNVANFNYA